jgi:uncharacterized protein (TIGR02466 family)
MVAFPTHVYTAEAPEFIKSVREVSLDYLKDSEKAHELYPVKMSGSMEMDPRIQDFAAFVAITSGNILADEGYQVNGMGAYFQSMWCQEHHKGSGMDQHTHPGSLMVGFYFIDVPEDSSAITFFDPRAGKVATPVGEANMADITYASNAFHMAAKPGLLVITNAWLAHAFTKHGGKSPLRFVHFNIGITEHNPEQNVEVI